MAVRLFNPKTRAFSAINLPDGVALPLDQLLLINILVELQTLTHLLHATSPNLPADDPQALRAAVFQE